MCGYVSPTRGLPSVGCWWFRKVARVGLLIVQFHPRGFTMTTPSTFPRTVNGTGVLRNTMRVEINGEVFVFKLSEIVN